MDIEEEFINLFESVEMRQYMGGKFHELTPWQIVSAVYGARIDLRKKAAIFEELERIHPGEEEYKEYAEMVREAVEHTKAQEGDIFMVLRKEYNPKENCSEFMAPFSDFEEAVAYIKQDYKEFFAEELPEEEMESKPLYWYNIEKWNKNSNGDWEEIINFEVLGTGEVLYYFWGTGKNIYFNRPDMEPNLPIPFQVGDIIIMDCTPYFPKRLGLVVEVGDNYDCCSRQCLYINRKGRVSVNSLIHKSVFRDLGYYILVTSPLYRVERFNGEIKAEDNILKMLSNFIQGDEESGRKLWYFISENPSGKKQSISKKRLKNEFLKKVAK